VKKAKS